MEDYKPLQDKPTVDLMKAKELIEAFERLLPAVSF